LLANRLCQATDSNLAHRARQQAGSYSRLHSASKACADGEIGVCGAATDAFPAEAGPTGMVLRLG
jgi:hypothetical protein